ncbi:MAG: tetratricopeptide repeat protein [Bacteroidales bacterium]|nr:tetratricopeptide repeat protein [Bacteroidales bacterium]
MKNVVRHIVILALVAFAFAAEARAQYDTDAFSLRGRQALADGRYATAIENFNILARIDSTDNYTYFFRGIAKYNLGDLRGAMRDFDTSVRLNPVFTSGYHYRAITRSRVGQYDKALEDLETAIHLRPGFTGLYYSRGVTYFLSQQFEKAVADFNRYIKKEPRDPSAYLNRGASLLFLGDTLKALDDYNKAIKLDRFDPEGYLRRGRLYAGQQKFEEAIADLDKAVDLDSTNTFAYFNRALMLYDMQDYNRAMADLNRVLKDEPGNALTLYNRGLISAQVGDFGAALEDMDRVLNINPNNVLAYFNRASIFIEMERYEEALEDYDKAIELYPDFAKAYMNRSYVNNLLGHKKASKSDYETAQKKVREYREKNRTDAGSFADTTKKYSSLLALDADFAKKDFDDELLQHRDIDIRLKPLYRFVLASDRDNTKYALSRKYENSLLSKFESSMPYAIEVSTGDSLFNRAHSEALERKLYGAADDGSPRNSFMKALLEGAQSRFNSSLGYYDMAIGEDDELVLSSDRYEALYRAFYLMNRGVLRAEMIDFLASIETSVQVLSMDDSGRTRARVKDQVGTKYDYSEAIADMSAAALIVNDLPYLYFNLGNLYCLASEHVESIENYTKAISLYPYMGDAFYNRGLVLIYLKDKEKACIDLSRAGELGVAEAYGVIKKYCEEEE